MNLTQFRERARSQQPRCCWYCHEREATIFDLHHVYDDGRMIAYPMCDRCWCLAQLLIEPEGANDESAYTFGQRSKAAIDRFRAEGVWPEIADSRECPHCIEAGDYLSPELE